MRFAFLPAALLLSCSILGSGFPALAQNRGNNNSQFYDGARRGSQGGNYGGGRYHDHHYDNRDQGGIGPGKGALIGGAAGAVLGAAFGGVQGSLITGAAGAGIGGKEPRRDSSPLSKPWRSFPRKSAAVVLPDKETVGREFGEYIKAQAKLDRDQLLYVIVDRAVRKYGTAPAAGGSK